MNERTFNNDDNGKSTNLIYLTHPWESGMDNSVVWDQPLNFSFK